jgi:hypothetical protein
VVLATEHDEASASDHESPWARVAPIDEVAAGDLAVGDVVRLDDPQAHRVEEVMIVDGRVILDLRPVGLAVPDTRRVTVPVETVIDRLGSAAE